jgi:ABC-type methionine transport system permease subunit
MISNYPSCHRRHQSTHYSSKDAIKELNNPTLSTIYMIVLGVITGYIFGALFGILAQLDGFLYTDSQGNHHSHRHCNHHSMHSR